MARCLMCRRPNAMGLRHMPITNRQGQTMGNGLICASCRNKGDAQNLEAQRVERDRENQLNAAQHAARQELQTRAGVPEGTQHGAAVSMLLESGEDARGMEYDRVLAEHRAGEVCDVHEHDDYDYLDERESQEGCADIHEALDRLAPGSGDTGCLEG